MTDPAIDSLRAALDVAPDDASLRQMLAERLADRGRVDEAIDEYRTAIRCRPGDSRLQLALARLYLGSERHAAADVLLEQVLGTDPTLAEAHLIRARALLGLDRGAEAISEYKAATSLDGALADEALSVKLGFAARPPAVGGPVVAPEPAARTSQDKGAQATSESSPKPTQHAAPAARSEPPSKPRQRVPEGGPAEEEEPEDGVIDTPEERALLERPLISFKDVGGMEQLKEEIRLKILYPRLHPDLYRAYGKKAGGGILLYGPPGCGKTHLARATAGELGAVFIVVGIADVLDMWVGSSERNLQRIFAVARSNTPAVLFFDEVDALAASRADFKGSAGRHVINQFLAELDGAESSNEGLLVIGATNAPWHMDSAFRRPGRFDQIVFVPPPDVAARAAILQVLLRDRPAGDVDINRVAAASEGYSGADLLGMVDRAIEVKLAAALREGVPRPISTDDLMKALKGVPATTREWFATVRNYVLYANEGGLYDPVRPYLKGR